MSRPADGGNNTPPQYGPTLPYQENPSVPSTAPTGAATGNSQDLHGFVTAVLQGLGIAPNSNNVAAMMAWAQAEGGSARYNPLNTTQTWTGTSNYNSVGVKNYGSFQDGVAATIKTLKNGRYGPILQSLSSDPGSIGDALKATPWGTNGDLVTKILAGGKVNNRLLSGNGSNGTVTYSGSVGGGSYQSTTSPTVGKVDQQTFDEELQQAGFSSALIHSDKSLMQLFQTALSKGWDPNGLEFENALRQTAWYKTRNNYQRAYDEAQYADPASFNRELQQRKATLQAEASQMGLTLDPNRLDALAKSFWRNGSNNDEIRAGLAAEFHYKPGQAYGGDYGAALNAIKKSAVDYGVTLSDQTLGQFAQNVAGGKATADQYVDYMKTQALSKYPWLKDQINSGLTVSQIADPYKQEMANVLEIDPNSVKLNDPTVLKGLQYMDPQNTKAGYSTMPLYAYQDMLRNDPRWAATNNARNAAMDTGTEVLRQFGLVS